MIIILAAIMAIGFIMSLTFFTLTLFIKNKLGKVISLVLSLLCSFIMFFTLLTFIEAIMVKSILLSQGIVT